MSTGELPLAIVYTDVTKIPPALVGRCILTIEGTPLLVVDDLGPEEKALFWRTLIEDARAAKGKDDDNPPRES